MPAPLPATERPVASARRLSKYVPTWMQTGMKTMPMPTPAPTLYDAQNQDKVGARLDASKLADATIAPVVATLRTPNAFTSAETSGPAVDVVDGGRVTHPRPT